MKEKNLEHSFYLGNIQWFFHIEKLMNVKEAFLIRATSKLGVFQFAKNFNENEIFQLMQTEKDKPFLLKMFTYPDFNFRQFQASVMNLEKGKSFIFLPLFVSGMKKEVLKDSLRAVSYTDLNKLIYLEQVSAILKLSKLYGEYLEKHTTAILPEAYEEYELEWRLDDVFHETSSTLTKISLAQEEKLLFETLREDSLTIEKALIKERDALEFRAHLLKKTMSNLLDALASMPGKIEKIQALIQSAKLLNELLEERNRIDQESHLKWLIFDFLIQTISTNLGLKVLDCDFRLQNEGFIAFLAEISFISLKGNYSADEILNYFLEQKTKLLSETSKKIDRTFKSYFKEALQESLNYYPIKEKTVNKSWDFEIEFLKEYTSNELLSFFL